MSDWHTAHMNSGDLTPEEWSMEGERGLPPIRDAQAQAEFDAEYDEWVRARYEQAIDEEFEYQDREDFWAALIERAETEVAPD